MLVAFDFDQTISVVHLYHLMRKDETTELDSYSNEFLKREVFGGEARLKLLAEHFHHLIANGATLCIISFGFTLVIIEALRRVNLIDFFSRQFILGIDSPLMQEVRGYKDVALVAVMKHLGIDDAASVIFVDDDVRNVEAVEANIPSCYTLLIQPAAGMTSDHLRHIEDRTATRRAQIQLH